MRPLRTPKQPAVDTVGALVALGDVSSQSLEALTALGASDAVEIGLNLAKPHDGSGHQLREQRDIA